jgi:hypothetical protein
MKRVAAALLTLESVVVMLAIPVAVAIADIDPVIAIPVGLGVGLAMLIAAALCRRGKPGYVAGSVMQVVAIASGFVVPAMFFLGGIFAVLWVILMRIGPGVDAAQERTQ